LFPRFFASSIPQTSKSARETVTAADKFEIATDISSNASKNDATASSIKNGIRLSKLLSHDATKNLALSRRQAERLIRGGEVTLAGKIIQTPMLLVDFDEILASSAENRPMIKLSGKPVLFDPSIASTTSTTSSSVNNNDVNQQQQQSPSLDPRVWAVHKLKGEVVTENDPYERPSLIERLKQSGVGKTRRGGKHKRQQIHLKPIGRLDMPTEGLILVTNDGGFAREMELPSSKIHRVYRVRVHGRLTPYKLDHIRRGRVQHENVRYPPMQVALEKKRARAASSNTWLRVTCAEGKNRQVRNVFAALGVTVTRLIRVAYGDYRLESIPPGMAIPVPYKSVTQQKAKGRIGGSLSPKKKIHKKREDVASPVKWVTSI